MPQIVDNNVQNLKDNYSTIAIRMLMRYNLINWRDICGKY